MIVTKEVWYSADVTVIMERFFVGAVSRNKPASPW